MKRYDLQTIYNGTTMCTPQESSTGEWVKHAELKERQMSYSPVYKWRIVAENLIQKLVESLNRKGEEGKIELIDCAEKFEFDQEKAYFKLALETTDEHDQDCGLSLIVDIPNAQAWLSNGLNRVGDMNVIEVK